MAETTAMICTNCPMGCPLQLVHEGNSIVEVSGHECNRGAKYAQQELLDPRRSLSTTVAISEALHKRLPVKTSGPVPKQRVMEATRMIHRIRVVAPVECGQVLLRDLLGEPGLNVVATRSLSRLV